MPELLRMPAVAAGTDEATLSGWPVPERQPFRINDVIATVETAKAAVDVPAEQDGVIVRKLVAPGAEVRVGEPIALLAAPGEVVADVSAALVALGVGAVRDGDRVFASPLARRLAKEAGIDYRTLAGSGPNGRITRVDVAAAVAAQRPEPVRTTEPVQTPEPLRTTEVVPHSRMRQEIARRLVESKQTIPHFYLRGTAHVDELLALRSQLNSFSPTKISINDLVLKAVALAHSEVDGVNAIWADDGTRRFDSVDLGVAVATEGGLVAPVLRGVERLSIVAIAEGTRDLADRARSGRLRPEELAGGATTVTNLGGFGVEEFSAIINPPQSSILAVGAARKEPVVAADDTLKAATVLRVTLSVDHRVIDGALAAEWMRVFLSIVEQPMRLLI